MWNAVFVLIEGAASVFFFFLLTVLVCIITQYLTKYLNVKITEIYVCNCFLGRSTILEYEFFKMFYLAF